MQKGFDARTLACYPVLTKQKPLSEEATEIKKKDIQKITGILLIALVLAALMFAFFAVKLLVATGPYDDILATYALFAYGILFMTILMLNAFHNP